jgi:hypothetical protein
VRVPDYTGTVAFASTDERATLPGFYTFRLSDEGIAYFPGGVTFRTPGTQRLFVFDIIANEIIGFTTLEVV